MAEAGRSGAREWDEGRGGAAELLSWGRDLGMDGGGDWEEEGGVGWGNRGREKKAGDWRARAWRHFLLRAARSIFLFPVFLQVGAGGLVFVSFLHGRIGIVGSEIRWRGAGGRAGGRTGRSWRGGLGPWRERAGWLSDVACAACVSDVSQ
jgi:hypothetical protein